MACCPCAALELDEQFFEDLDSGPRLLGALRRAVCKRRSLGVFSAFDRDTAHSLAGRHTRHCTGIVSCFVRRDTLASSLAAFTHGRSFIVDSQASILKLPRRPSHHPRHHHRRHGRLPRRSQQLEWCPLLMQSKYERAESRASRPAADRCAVCFCVRGLDSIRVR